MARTWTLLKNSKRSATWHIRGSPSLPTYSNCGYSLATNSHATQSGQSKNTATNTKFSNILFFLYTNRLYFISSVIIFFLLIFLLWIDQLSTYISINNLKRGRSSFTTPMTKTTATKEYRTMSICRKRSTNYGSPP